MNKSKDKININPDIFSEIPKVSSTQYMIAYLDLLGSKDRIENDIDDLQLNAIYSLYNATLNEINLAKKILNINDIELKIFSDNIVIAKEISNDENNIANALKEILLFTDIMQITAFAGSGWLIRGAVTTGNLYIDNVLIWGKALLRAYELEQIIKYPRVVIDDAVINKLSHETKSNFMSGALKKDSDGYIYDNYFKSMITYSKSIPIWNEHLKHFEEHLKDYPPAEYSEKIRKKLYWTAQKYGEEIGDPEFVFKCKYLNNGGVD